MSLSTSTSRISYTGDGSNKVFAFPYLVYDSSHLQVYLAGVLQSSGYSVSLPLGLQAGVTITFTTAPGSSVLIDILRVIPNTQLVTLQVAGAFPAKTVEKALDLVVMGEQQFSENLTRALTAPIPETSVGPIPNVATRSNKYLAFNSSGNPIAVDPATASGTSVLATGSTVARILADRFSDVRNALDYASIDAAVASLGAGPGVVLIPSSYSGPESANLSFNAVDGSAYNLYRGQDNITVIDYRSQVNKAYHVNYGGTILGSLTRLAVTQSKASPSSTTSAILATTQVTGDLSAGGGALAGLTAEIDTEGTLTGISGNIIQALTGQFAVRSTGQTLPFVAGVEGGGGIDRTSTTTNITTAVGISGDAITNASSSGATITDAFSGRFQNQTVGTRNNHAIACLGNQLFASGKGIDSENGSSPAIPLLRFSELRTTLQLAIVEKLSTISYSSSMTPNASLGNIFVITATNGTAFTINAPSNPATGQRITVTIRNAAGGGLGAATWNAAFKMGAAWTQPANGFSRSIDFYYDGTNWIEKGRTAADVSN